jgi:pimeloyl-ACP methyl ester carboxylesterase
VPAPHTVTVATDDGVQLAVDVSGEGPDVLLVPGLGYGAWSWFPQAADLGRDHHVIALDNRGAARSDKPPGPYSIDRLARDAAAVLEAVATGPATVVGASMGGYIASTLAVRRPDLVASLVLVATSVGGPGAHGVPAETKSAWAAAAALPPEEFARRTMPLSFGPHWVTHHPDEFEDLLRRRLAHPTPADPWRAQFLACEDFLDDGLAPGTVDRPVTVIHGLADRVVPAINADRITDRFPQAVLLLVPEAGHLCWIERPALVTEAIRTSVASRIVRGEPTC